MRPPTNVLYGLLSSGLLLAVGPTLLTAQEGEQCVLCHPAERVLAEQSIHASEGVGCTGCHGGDPESLDEVAAHRGNYRPLAERRQIPAACAECHADLERMRPYNLPVDQYALYQTSQHGKALARGEDRVAVCTDCHGVHDIRRAGHPSAPVSPRNLAETCGRCHGDRALMERYGHDPGTVEDYLGSVHGQAVSDGNLAAPTCINCHGVHGATPPGVGDIDKICGSCHTETRRAFLAGPHHRAMLAAGLPECESCHSNHAIQRFAASEFESVCLDCHQEDESAVDVGRKLQTLVLAAQEEIDRAEQLTLEAERVPLDVEDHLSRLNEARTYLTESRSLLHAVSLEPVEEVTRRARSIGEEIQHELYAEMDRTNAHIGLAVFWFYLLMTLVILFVYKKRLRRLSDSR